jgi:1-acyl-sn-glycerol-3-phosphate acyltransferase
MSATSTASCWQAALPPSFSFVIKREMSSVPLAGTLLRRIGAEFVERQDRRRLAQDARRLLRKAELGQALVFFPEGTFSAEVGLLRFHIGAFAAAARAGMEVIPVAIRGTRACLPPGRHVLPRPGADRGRGARAIAGAAAHHEPERVTALRDARARVLCCSQRWANPIWQAKSDA